MKKLFFITCLCLISFRSFAELKKFDDCVPFEGKNGKRYCYSAQYSGTWFSGAAWCDAQGLRMATLSELCDISDLPYERYTRDIYEISCRNRVGQEEIPSGLYFVNSVSSAGGASVAKNNADRPNHDSRNWARRVICKLPD